MKIKEGDEVKSDLDSRDYIVTKVESGMVILRSSDAKQVVIATGIDSLETFYKKKEDVKLNHRKESQSC
jgi:hypothetical protein